MAEEVKNTASSKLTSFLEKNRKGVLTALVVIICVLIGYIVTNVILDNAKNKALAAIDEISYEMTEGSKDLDDSELTARETKALDALAVYTKKGGVAGVRANMLCAEISFQQKNYEDSVNYWKAAANKGKKSYTAPLANYNMAVCYEMINNLEEAAKCYKVAADNEGFALNTHAKFSLGRVLEANGDFEGAIAAYTDLFDKNPNSEWAKIAKTRVLSLQIEGKAE